MSNEEHGRIKRIESAIQMELAQLIEREIKDPRLDMVTVTQVKVSKDLSMARIYVLLRDESKIKDNLAILNRASRFLRHRLAQIINLRKTPELKFYYDDVISQGIRISQLLQNEQEPTETP